MKALVTGATGFIGSHLCEKLVKQGFEVTSLSRGTSNQKWIESLDIIRIKGDCTIPESLQSVVSDFDYVFHIAGLTKSLSRDAFFSVNYKGTENLIKAVAERNSKVKRFLYLSSLAAAGPGRNGNPIIEETTPNPVSDYGRSKLEGEREVLKYKNQIPITIIRPPAVYGPRDRDMLVIFKLMKKGFFFDLGKCYYSMLYIDDLIQGILLGAEAKKAEGQTYFLSDGLFYTGEDIAREISLALDVKARPLKVPKCFMPFFAFIGEKINKQGIINRDRIKDFKHTQWVCDSSKAREELGFIPKVKLKEGIKWTTDWYRIHRWL